MVRNYIRKTVTAYTREQLKEAEEKVKNGELSIYKASIRYNIPRSTLLSRALHKRGLKGRGRFIPEKIEKKIANNLHEIEKCGFRLTTNEIVGIIGEYLNNNNIKNCFKNGIPGEQWFSSFKKRYNLVVNKFQSEAKSRRNAFNPWIIYSYFYLLKNTMDELQLHDKPSHIWNIDESNFYKDPINTKDTSQRRYASKRTIASLCEDNTTVLLGCNASGDKIPPFIIFKGEYLWDKWVSNEGYPNTVYAATENGMMEPDLFETFFEGVILPTVGTKRPALLIYDGHSIHIGINVIEKAREAGITILKIPMHTTDILQPLNLVIEKSFKDKLNQCTNQWKHLHMDQVLSNKEFSKLIGEVWTQTEPDSCVEEFQKAGVFPYNGNVVPEDKCHPNQLEKFNKKCTSFAAFI